MTGTDHAGLRKLIEFNKSGSSFETLVASFVLGNRRGHDAAGD
jgi:hypothetical protein